MKELIAISPEYDVGDQVSYLNVLGEVCKGIVKNISQTIEENNRIYYQLVNTTSDKGFIVIEEKNLLFAETDAKPLFNIGMTVANIDGVSGTITSMNIQIDTDGYYITYELDNGELIDEDTIMYVQVGG